MSDLCYIKRKSKCFFTCQKEDEFLHSGFNSSLLMPVLKNKQTAPAGPFPTALISHP